MDAYPLVRAARYLNVPPWELAERPTYWRELASIFEAADIAAINEQKKRHAAINK